MAWVGLQIPLQTAHNKRQTISVSEIQSNYPRKPQIAAVKVDVPFLQRAALSGLVFAIGQVVSLAAFGICINASGRDPVVFFVLGFSFLMFLGAGLGLMACIGIWVNRAYQAVCDIRGIESKLSATSVAILTVCFPMLPYALDFLDIRSKSADLPTMKWWSPYSKSMLTNVLFVLVLAAGLFLVVTFPSGLPRDYTALFLELFCVTYTTALFVGAIIVFRVNRNIVALVAELRPRKIIAWDLS